jgi:hypothetical protein
MDGAHGFDFWLGEWEARWDGGSGRNSVTAICDGAVVLERFSAGTEFTGASISMWDEGEGTWRQAWADSNRTWFHLRGGLADGVMELRTDPPNGDQKRMRFFDIAADAFTWEWSRTTDGAGWEPLWRIDYRRIGQPAATT